MREIIAFVSHVVRDRKDLVLIRDILSKARTQKRRDGVGPYLMAPYLLHAVTLADYARLREYRIGCASQSLQHGAVCYDELHLHGTVLCEAMCTEIQNALAQGMRIRAQSDQMHVLLQQILDSASLAAE